VEARVVAAPGGKALQEKAVSGTSKGLGKREQAVMDDVDDPVARNL